MCDTIAAVGRAAGGGAVFAKNSDRDPNEPQLVEIHPSASHDATARVRCTHMDVAQARDTHRTLLCRPAWMFGCEMGVNEHGVAIGNEAVFTRARVPKTGLTGMDLMRLALERTRTAADAWQCIVSLAAEHGQGGAASAFHPNVRYASSFLICDAREIWILEFAGAHWATQRIADGACGISNGLTIERDWTDASPAVKALRDRNQGFASHFQARVMTVLARARQRRARTEALACRGSAFDVNTAKALLRDHGPNADDTWHPGRATTACVCMHATGTLNPSQTTSSLVVRLDPEPGEIWVTGSSAPCLSLWKPVHLDEPQPLPTATPTGLTYDPQSFWWRHERLHRAALAGYPDRHAAVRDRYDALEAASARAWAAAKQGHARIEVSRQAFAAGDRALTELLGTVDEFPDRPRGGPFYRRFWRKWDWVISNPVTTETTERPCG